MCVMSAAIDQYKPFVDPSPKQAPYWGPMPAPTLFPNPITALGGYTVPVTPATAADMKKVLELLDKIDKRLGLLNCLEEAESKKAFMTKLQAVIDSEKRV